MLQYIVVSMLSLLYETDCELCYRMQLLLDPPDLHVHCIGEGVQVGLQF